MLPTSPLKYYILLLISFIVLVLFLKLTKSSTTSIENFKNQPKPEALYDVAFVINLVGTPEGEKSWKRMKLIKKFHNMVRFAGIHGKTYDYSDEVKAGIVNETWDIGKWKNTSSKVIPMEKSEIGISLSHYYVLKKIVDENIKVALVLEDDATKLHPQFETLLEQNFKLLPADWDMFLLGFWLHRGDNGYPVVDNKIYRVRDFVLLHAFIINNRGVRKLLANLPIDRPVDSWISKCAHENLVIYRHNIISNPKSKKPASKLVVQRREKRNKQIVNTNNW